MHNNISPWLFSQAGLRETTHHHIRNLGRAIMTGHHWYPDSQNKLIKETRHMILKERIVSLIKIVDRILHGTFQVYWHNESVHLSTETIQTLWREVHRKEVWTVRWLKSSSRHYNHFDTHTVFLMEFNQATEGVLQEGWENYGQISLGLGELWAETFAILIGNC